MVTRDPQSPRRAIGFIGSLRDWRTRDSTIEGVGDPAKRGEVPANRVANAIELPGFEVSGIHRASLQRRAT